MRFTLNLSLGDKQRRGFGCAGLSPSLMPLTKEVWSVQPKVSIRVDGATELGTKISQSEAAAANVRVMPELKFVADWPPQRLNSVAPLTRIETFG